MGYLEKVKVKIREASAAHAEAEAEKERQRLKKEKEEKKREIVKLSLEAEEFGISFADYVQYLSYKELKDNLEWIGDKIDEVHIELTDSSSSFYYLLNRKDDQ